MKVVEYIDPNKKSYPIKVIGMDDSTFSIFEKCSLLELKKTQFVLCTKVKRVEESTIVDNLILVENLFDSNEIDLLLEDSEMIILVAALGEKEISILLSSILKKSKEKNLFTLGLVMLPFASEGKDRIITALDTLEQIKEISDSLFVVNGERVISTELFSSCEHEEKMRFVELDVCNTIQRLIEIATTEGIINCDIAKIQTILSGHAIAVTTEGTAQGKNRLKKAIKKAIQKNLFLHQDLFLAKRMMFYIFCSDDDSFLLTVEELKELEYFTNKFENKELLLWGYSTSKEMKEEVRIIVIASGYDVY